MINFLCGMIKIMGEKMLNTIFLYWFYNGSLAENNSLDGYSNELE